MADPFKSINDNLADLTKISARVLSMPELIAAHQASALYHLAGAVVSLALVMETGLAAKNDKEGT